MTVSTLHPHKNLERLLEAFGRFRAGHREFRLVICGMHGFVTRALVELRRSLDLDSAVEFTGWLPREEVYELYSRAWAVVYPTLFEGFGMPLIEALAAGVPTTCSSIEPLVSLSGGAALLFEPKSVGAISDAMARVSDDADLRRELARSGPVRAAEFTWAKAARMTLSVLLAAAGSHSLSAVAENA